MKFKKGKNKKTKSFIKFDEEDRKNYLLGFRKRKQERKDKAKKEIEELKKKEKREIKKKRLEMIQEMLDARDSDSEDDDDNDYATIDSPPNNVTSTCGTSTVQISSLSLQSNEYLGLNEKNRQPFKQQNRGRKNGIRLKVPSSSSISNKTLKSSIWKTATKDAIKNFKAEKKKNKKKKVMVTEL